MGKPLVIFDNLIFSLQRTGGVSTMWAALIDEALQSGAVDCLFMEYPGALDNLCRQDLHIPKDKILLRKHPMPLTLERISSPLPGNYLLPDGTTLTSLIAKRKAIFHSPYYRTLKAGVRNIVTLHDFIHEKYSVSSALRRRMHKSMKKRALKNADLIACVSESTLQDLRELYPQYADKAEVVNNGIAAAVFSTDKDIAKYALPDKYLIYVGGNEDYKRFDLALKAAQRTNLTLVVCGKSFSSKERALLSDTEIISITEASPKSVTALMRRATALLYTSEYEGFGLPIIEAQSVGCPVIINAELNTGQIAEGTLSLDKEATNMPQIIDTLSDPAKRAAVVQSGFENAARYTAAEMAAKYLNCYIG